MTKTDWSIAKSSQVCTVCASKFEEGQSYWSVLERIEGGFQRRDFCPPCFQEHRPRNVFSFWKTAVPLEADGPKDRKPALDLESVIDFFKRLEGGEDQQKISFRFVLALMLTRKKVLDLRGSDREKDGREVLLFRERSGTSREEHRVVQPALEEQEIGAVSEELGRLLGLAPPAPNVEVRSGEEDQDQERTESRAGVVSAAASRVELKSAG